MSAPERYLIVSLGSIGRRHLANLRQLRPHSQIAALRLTAGTAASVPGCDLQFDRLEQVQAFAPQAAIIASPASAHLANASALVAMGVPLLIEKPFADQLEGLAGLIAAARARAVPLMVGYNLRFKRSLLEARRRLLDGEIGRIWSVRASVGQYLPDWRPASDYRSTVSAQSALGGGALLELSHEIDYLYWMFGMPDAVSCRGGRFSDLELDVEDTVELCLEYSHARRLVSVHLDFTERVTSRSCKFVGSEGTLLWDGMGDTVEVRRPGQGGTASAHLPMDGGNATYLAELAHFLDCVAGTATPAPDAVAAYDVMAIIDAARTSMRQRTVESPRPYERN